MSQSRRFVAVFPFLLLVFAATAFAGEPVPPSVSEIPAQFTPKTDSFDFVRRDEMVPMRDGVKLRTIVLVPKGAQGAPILLARTPYNANERMAHWDPGGARARMMARPRWMKERPASARLECASWRAPLLDEGS